ncbi:MAG: hypothetical protein L0287_04720 [Anaerolineae bacterium]|nr:hypothetical protein [Anaerolineae bacterium]
MEVGDRSDRGGIRDMLSIQKIPVPVNTMLGKYSSVTGAYTDCYVTEIPRTVSFAEFVFAFYTTPLFKLERSILKFTVSKPSTDNQARQVADGNIVKFAAWTVEARTENEMWMCDFLSRTRSWFMTKNDGAKTKLYFGSAVVPKQGAGRLEFGFRAMLGFHQVYSVLLLYSAKVKLEREI